MSHRYNLRSSNTTDGETIISEAEPTVTLNLANISLAESDSEYKTCSENSIEVAIPKPMASEPFSKKQGHMSKQLYDDLCKIGWGHRLEYTTENLPRGIGEGWVGKYTSG